MHTLSKMSTYGPAMHFALRVPKALSFVGKGRHLSYYIIGIHTTVQYSYHASGKGQKFIRANQRLQTFPLGKGIPQQYATLLGENCERKNNDGTAQADRPLCSRNAEYHLRINISLCSFI